MYGPAARCKRLLATLVDTVLRQCIRSPIGAVLRAIMDISAHAIFLADRPHRAVRVTRVRTRREDRSSIVVSSSRRTRRVSQACFLGDALACWSRFLQRGPSFSPSLRGLNFRQRVGDHDREIAQLQDKSMVIREHRGSFLQLFYQRFQSSVKLRYEVQCSLLEVGVQNLRKLKRPNVATIWRIAGGLS